MLMGGRSKGPPPNRHSGAIRNLARPSAVCTEAERDFDLDTLIGVIALGVALLSLWQGRRSSDAIKEELAEFRRTNELLAAQSDRQANHIDDLPKEHDIRAWGRSELAKANRS